MNKALQAELKRFGAMTEDELFSNTASALLDFEANVDHENEKQLAVFFGSVAASLKLGFGRRPLSEKQILFARDLYALLSTHETFPDRYKDVLAPVDASDYGAIELYNRWGILPFGRDTFYMLLGAAFTDGSPTDETVALLDAVFKELFRYYSVETALDAVPVVTDNVCGLDARIVDWFFRNNDWKSFAEIKLAFPDETVAALKESLDWLCIRGIIDHNRHVIGEPYTLAADKYDVRLDLSRDAEKIGDKISRTAEPGGGTKGKKYPVAYVVFTPGGRQYEYICELPVRPGDRCVVEVDGEEKTVTVARLDEKTEDELARPLFMCKLILRKADS